jgi:cell division septal protein FtsQ
MNSREFKAQSKAEKAEIEALVRMMARAQVMTVIVKVLFWVVMAGVVAFGIWICLLPPPP